MFGLPRLAGASEDASPGRRHSSTQLSISETSQSPTRTERWRSLARVVLGDVEEQQESEEPGETQVWSLHCEEGSGEVV